MSNISGNKNNFRDQKVGKKFASNLGTSKYLKDQGAKPPSLLGGPLLWIGEFTQ